VVVDSPAEVAEAVEAEAGNPNFSKNKKAFKIFERFYFIMEAKKLISKF
jgi:hypothetical protein